MAHMTKPDVSEEPAARVKIRKRQEQRTAVFGGGGGAAQGGEGKPDWAAASRFSIW